METGIGRIGLVLSRLGSVSPCIVDDLSALRDVLRPLGGDIEWLPLVLERPTIVIEAVAIVTEPIAIASLSLAVATPQLAVAT